MISETCVAFLLKEGVSVDGYRGGWVYKELALNLRYLVYPPGFAVLGTANRVLTDNLDLLCDNSLIKI